MEQAEYPRFSKLVVELFAKYPQSAMSEATIPAYWREMRKYGAPAVEWAFANVGKGNPQFCPSAEAVRETADVEQKRLDVIARRAARGIDLVGGGAQDEGPREGSRQRGPERGEAAESYAGAFQRAACARVLELQVRDQGQQDPLVRGRWRDPRRDPLERASRE